MYAIRGLDYFSVSSVLESTYKQTANTTKRITKLMVALNVLL
jgi:ABC-type phosphate transport system auxiliary subunit